MQPIQERFKLQFEWRGFELHPEIPVGGVDIRRMFPADRVAVMHARLREVAEGFGLPFSPPMHAPNTRKALAISALAREQGRLDAWREAAMNAHWRDGQDIEDPEVLGGLAQASGLDPAAALAFLESPEVPRLLAEQRAEAARWGVTGIPTWFMLPEGWAPMTPWPQGGPRPVRVVGCQPMEVVERAARMAGATPIEA
ncbi:MAG: DsbA family protein [Alphaproteobacteria bacterium]|nr:DsbA family protein [Alphaproteobacteria bacterium]